MDAGDLVPDEVTNAMVRDRLGEPDAAERLPARRLPAQRRPGRRARQHARRPRRPRSTSCSTSRSTTTRSCGGCPAAGPASKCGHVWHVEFDPPTVEDVCDQCGGELYQRDDDQPETVRHRLEVYADQTAPLIEFYTSRGQLVGDRRARRRRGRHRARDRCSRRIRRGSYRPTGACDVCGAPRADRAQDRRPDRADARGRAGRRPRRLARCARPPRPASRPPISTRSPATCCASAGATSSFLRLRHRHRAYPGVICASVNDRDRARHPVARRTCWATAT